LRAILFALLLCFAPFALPAALGAEPSFPALTGRVVDNAQLLDAASRSAIESKLADLETKTGRQLVVVTLPSLQGYEIEEFGYQLGRHWGIGQKGTNTGALLIVAPKEHQVRIEVGYGLEGVLTDAVSRLIIENAILPRFRANDFAGGIQRGVDDIIQVLTVDPEEWKQRAKQRPDSQPGTMDIVVVILFLFVAFMILRSVMRDRRGPGSRARRGSVFVPVPAPWGSGWDSSGSSWSGSSGGGFGGGGFSGGGGSFGGGGASGSW